MKNNKNLLAYMIPAAYAGYRAYKYFSRPAKRKNLRGQVVVITGASSGIGKAYAGLFAAEGCKLVLAARRTELLEKLAAELKEKYNSEILVVTTDVSKEADARNLIEEALDRFNYIDILINNAGIACHEFFYKDSTDNMKKVMDVNYWGLIYCTHAALPAMIKRGRGKIVNVSSFAGKRGVPVMANYVATKHAVNGFSESLRLEVSKHGIDVIVICPTSTKTDIISTSINNSAFKLDAANYPGMTPERVAKETLNAILDNKAELIIGAAEKVGYNLDKISPAIVNFVLKKAMPYVMKD